MWAGMRGVKEGACGDRVGKRARSRPGESCKSNLYPRRWESQTILTDADVIRFAF